MREILFKAKRTDNGKWVEGYLYRLSENHPPFIMLNNRFGESYEVDQSTICQFTGLTDKNGQKIWENDVALRTSSQGLFTGKIIYDKNGCLCHRKFQTDFEALLIGSDRNIEVIGNIFDNPELLSE